MFTMYHALLLNILAWTFLAIVLFYLGWRQFKIQSLEGPASGKTTEEQILQTNQSILAVLVVIFFILLNK